MSIDDRDQFMADLKDLAESIADRERLFEEVEARQRATVEGLNADRQRFTDLVGRATDGRNAIVFAGRAWWVTNHSLCYINLNDRPPVRSEGGVA
jgi:hypothetical protein